MTYAELRRALESLPLEDDEEVVIEVDVFHQYDGVENVFSIGQVAYEEPSAGDGYRAVLVGGFMVNDGIERKRYDLDHIEAAPRLLRFGSQAEAEAALAVVESKLCAAEERFNDEGCDPSGAARSMT